MATDEMALFTRTDSGDVSDRATVRCPLCVFEHDPQTMYRHLQKSHRKSELSRTLLDRSHQKYQTDATSRSAEAE